MKTLTNLLGLIAMAAGAQAATVGVDFANSGGTTSGSGFTLTRTYVSGSVTVTVTAWGLTGNSNTTFQQGELGQFGGAGLGVCDHFEGTGCNSPEHRVDNNGSQNFVLFQFSGPVSLTSVLLNSLYNDSDASYYSGNISGSLSGKTLAQLAGMGFGGRQDADINTNNSSRTVNLVTGGPVNALLFGARLGGNNADWSSDYFKIGQLNGTTTATPEPATLGTIGAALLGLGLVRRKRK